jgi:hypothetical protein
MKRGGDWLGLACPHCADPVYLLMPRRNGRASGTLPNAITCAHCGRIFALTARMRFEARVMQGQLHTMQRLAGMAGDDVNPAS